MIELPTGALIDRELSSDDFEAGKKFSPKLGLLMTYQPCSFCFNDGCRRSTFKECEKAYLEKWKEKYGGPTNAIPTPYQIGRVVEAEADRP